MADNITILDSSRSAVTMKTKDTGTEHIPFHAIADPDTPANQLAIESDGSITVNIASGATIEATGGLTDDELRATPVPVSGSVSVDPTKAATANTPSISSSATAIASNSARKMWYIQNLGTNVLYVLMGSGASSSVFHFAVPPGLTNDDGLGGGIGNDVYTGIVTIAGTSPRYTATEL